MKYFSVLLLWLLPAHQTEHFTIAGVHRSLGAFETGFALIQLQRVAACRNFSLDWEGYWNPNTANVAEAARATAASRCMAPKPKRKDRWMPGKALCSLAVRDLR